MIYEWEEKDIRTGVELRVLHNYAGTLSILEDFVLCKVMFDGKPDLYVIMSKRNYAVHSCNLLTAAEMAKKLTREGYLPLLILAKE